MFASEVMFKRIAMIAASLFSAIGFGVDAGAAAPPDAWAQEIADCADATGMTATGVSGGGAEIVVSQTGRFIFAELFAGLGSRVEEYMGCIIDAGRAPGWFAAVIGQTSDADGLQAVTFGGEWTILWSYDSDDNVVLVVVTTDPVTLG